MRTEPARLFEGGCMHKARGDVAMNDGIEGLV